MSRRQSAKARHPSRAGWRPDRRRFTELMAERLRQRGEVEHPDAAARVLALRGTWGDTPEEFAERVGVTVARLASLEAGEQRITELPARIRRLADELEAG